MPPWLSGALGSLIVGAPMAGIALLSLRQTRASHRDTVVLDTGKLTVEEKTVDLSILLASITNLEGRLEDAEERVTSLEGDLDDEKTARAAAEQRAGDAEARAAAAESRAAAAEEQVRHLEQRVAELEKPATR